VAVSGSVVSEAGSEAEHWHQVDRIVVRGRQLDTLVFVPVAP